MPISLLDGAANTDYATKLPVFVNGTLLEQVDTITLRLDTGITKVFTQETGLGGFASGEKFISVDVKLKVPVSGPEAEFWNQANNEEWVSLQVGVGRRDVISEGKFTNVSVERSGTTPVEVSFTWEAPAAPME